MLPSLARFKAWCDWRARISAIALCLLLAAPAGAQNAGLPVQVVPQLGDNGIIYVTAVSPDGRFIATGSSDNLVSLWDVGTGREIRTFVGHSNHITGIAFLPDGKRLVTSGDTRAHVWNLETGQKLQTMADKELVDAIAVSYNGRLLVVDSRDEIKVWDLERRTVLRSLGQGFGEHAVSFSPDDKTILTGGKAGHLRLWDASSGQLLHDFDQADGIKSAAFSPDGHLVAVTIHDKIKLWEVESGRQTRTIPAVNADQTIAFSPDGQRLLSTGINGSFQTPKNRVQMWDLRGERLLWEKLVSDTWDNGPNSGQFLADGKAVIIGLGDGTVRILDARTGQETGKLKGRSEQISSLRASPDGRSIAVGTRNNSIRLWDLGNGRETRSLPGYTNGVHRIAYSPDGRLLGSTGLGPRLLGSTGPGSTDDDAIRIWSVVDGKLLRIIKERAGAVVFAPEGNRVLWANSNEEIKLLDLDSKSVPQTLGRVQSTENGVHRPPSVYNIFNSPDGFRVAGLQPLNEHTAGDPTFKLWAADGHQILAFDVFHDQASDLSTDGSKLALAGEFGDVEIRDARDGRQIKRFDFKERVIPDAKAANSLRWAPDGNRLALANNDSRIRLLDVDKGQVIKTFEGHFAAVHRVDFLGNGRLVSASVDGTIKLWDIESGLLIGTAMSFLDGEWVFITPEGFFDLSSVAAAKNLSIVRGLEIYSIDQFYQALYRPDLVREKLQGDPRGLVREAAARLDLAKAIESGQAPDVRLTMPSRAIAGRTQGTVNADIIDRGGGIGRVEWRVNGVTVGIDNPDRAPSGQPLQLSRVIALDTGSNDVTVVAYNRANLVASLPASISVVGEAPPPAQPAKPSAQKASPGPTLPARAGSRLFVLALGENDYADARFRLRYSVADATAMGRALSEAGKGLYQGVEVKLMSDAEVVAGQLDAVFRELAAKMQLADVFVLYVAGHGKTVDGRYYFAPQNFHVDGKLSDPAIDAAVQSLGISQEQWQRWLSLVPARRSLVLFDTCESGTLTADAAETRQLEQGAANDRLAQATGRSIMTASSGNADAFEGYHGHGVFTYSLLDAIGHADSDKNGLIDISELAAFVYAEVTAISERLFRERQEPQMKLSSNYPLTRQTHVLSDEGPPIALNIKPTHQLEQVSSLQVKPGEGATVVRSLSANMPVSVVASEKGWSLVASEGRLLGYVAARDLAPVH
jgi:WD40 repeat protein/uncharacterized caspase-like protein